MKLSRRHVDAPRLLDLPERAVQFGTGAFLRGFIGDFIDRANRQGKFGGRIVAVATTTSGREARLNEQDGLYTLVRQGIENGAPTRSVQLISSTSRALSAATQWDEVLRCARSPELELVFSNTTEIGIALDESDSPLLSPPRSFPGKLTRFLYERALAFNFDPAKGVTVVPCELIEDNGDRLSEIVEGLAKSWKLGSRFTTWVHTSVQFCNTLVDRIVPGGPTSELREELTRELGYTDELLTVCEPYGLFAIREEPKRNAIEHKHLRWAAADPGVILTANERPYRERKVRLLNGAHTIVVPVALLCGTETVAEATEHELVGAFLRQVLFSELVPSLDTEGAEQFAEEVLDRFANPFIRHALIDITLQQTTKMRVRVVPAILDYTKKMGRAPHSIAFGFAAFLQYHRRSLQRPENATRPDDQAEQLRGLWRTTETFDPAALLRLVEDALSRVNLWGTDLTRVPGFAEAVGDHLLMLTRKGPLAALQSHMNTPGVGA